MLAICSLLCLLTVLSLELFATVFAEMYSITGPIMTFMECESHCSNIEATVACVSDAAQDEDLRASATMNMIEHVWVGYNDHDYDGSWRWPDGCSSSRVYGECGDIAPCGGYEADQSPSGICVTNNKEVSWCDEKWSCACSVLERNLTIYSDAHCSSEIGAEGLRQCPQLSTFQDGCANLQFDVCYTLTDGCKSHMSQILEHWQGEYGDMPGSIILESQCYVSEDGFLSGDNSPPMYNECPKAACSYGNFPADADCCRACKERPDEDSCGCCDGGVADNSSGIGITVILVIVFAVAFLVALAYICGTKAETPVTMVNADRQQSYHQPIGDDFCPDAAEYNYPSAPPVVTATAVDDKTDMTNAMAIAQIVNGGGGTTNDGRAHTTKFCGNCGILLNANENQNRFCVNCGAQI